MDIVLILICLGILVLFLTTKTYDSIKGLVIILLYFTVLFLRLRAEASELLFNRETLVVSGLWNLALVIFSIFVLYLTRRKKKMLSLKYLLIVFILYIPFGFFQQLLFQFVFMESIYHMVSNTIASVVLGSIFYGIIHYRTKSVKFVLSTFLINVLWASIYIRFGNIIWLTFSHALLGTLYAYWFIDGNAIKKNIRFLKNVNLG